MDQHLTDAEINELLRTKAFGDDGASLNSDINDPRFNHVKQCTLCYERLRGEFLVESSFASLSATSVEPAKPDCPDPGIWTQIAAGILTEGSDEALSHACECDRCAVLLREVTVDLSSDISSREAAYISGLRSSSSSWQASVAESLAGSAKPSSGKGQLRHLHASPTGPAATLWLRPLFVLGAVLVVCCTLMFWILQVRRSKSATSTVASVSQLLGRVYAQQRPLELRIPDADYGQLDAARAPRFPSDFASPPQMLQAEEAIETGLQNHPRDPAWLDLEARADLLKWHFDAAIQTLETAPSSSPRFIAIDLDLAAAHFERGRYEQSNRSGAAAEFNKSIDLLENVLHSDNDNLIAIFNLAYVCEQNSDYSCAAENWKKYLQLDPNSSWAGEARDHLKEVTLKQQGRLHEDQPPLLDEYALAALLSRDDPHAAFVLDRAIDEYQTKALTDWLPKLTSVGHQPAIVAALDGVADVLQRNHQDMLLRDLIKDNGNPDFSVALEALRTSIIANAAGNESVAITTARTSEDLFRKAKSPSGQLIARFEQAYAAQFLARAPECIRLSRASYPLAERSGYKWIAIQFSLEDAFCSNIQGNPSRSRLLAQRAAREARASNYSDLYLRATLGIAALEFEAGSPEQAWVVLSDGLNRFWGGEGSPTRGYSFYLLADALAESDQLWRVETVVLGEALQFMPQIRDPLVEAQIRFRAAEALIKTGDAELAQDNIGHAERLLARAPFTPARLHEQTTGTIELAQTEIERHSPTRALALLSQIHNLDRSYEVFDALEYYQAIGSAYWQLHRSQDAMRSFAFAIRICDGGAATLQSPRDRLSWTRSCSGAYHSLAILQYRGGAQTEALHTYEQLRAVTMNTLAPDVGLHGHQAAVLSRGVFAASGDRSPNAMTAIVTYLAADDGIVIWVHDRQQLRSRWISAPQSQVRLTANQFTRECSDPHSNILDLQRDSTTLYKWLVAPVRQLLHLRKELVIEPDSSLADIPFEALQSPQGDFLGTAFSIVVSPGGRFRLAALTDRNLTRDRALLVDPDYSDPNSGFLPLDDPHEEIAQIALMLSEPTVLVGASATRRSIEAALPTATIFHYAGHSEMGATGDGLLVRDDQNSSPSVMLWNASALSKVVFHHCKLAVLSACATANSAQGDWMDRDSLVFSLLSSGVPHVVASRWNVNSAITSTIMQSFYKHLLERNDVPQALQGAEQMIRTDPRTSHPYYWAAFTAFGS